MVLTVRSARDCRPSEIADVLLEILMRFGRNFEPPDLRPKQRFVPMPSLQDQQRSMEIDLVQEKGDLTLGVG